MSISAGTVERPPGLRPIINRQLAGCRASTTIGSIWVFPHRGWNRILGWRDGMARLQKKSVG